MLPEFFLDSLPDAIVELYEEYSINVIKDIARRLAKTGRITSTAAWQLQRLSESGQVYENAIRELAKVTGISEQELLKAFRRAGVRAMRFDDAIYRAAGLAPLPLNLSPAMANVLAAGLRKTGGIMRNLTMTTAVSAQQSFERAADLAYMQITGGTHDYNSAIKQAVKRVAGDGLRVINYSGRKDHVDVAMRRAVLTGVNQTVGELKMARADEMGTDLVQTTAHSGARPTHEEWQGQIFSRSGTSKKYPPFVESTGYGTVTGLMGINCRHNFYPFFEGISENAYSAEMLKEINSKTVKYQGREMSLYDASQEQRKIERKIRYWKRQAAALDAAGFTAQPELDAVKRYQKQMRDFIASTGMRREYPREQVY